MKNNKKSKIDYSKKVSKSNVKPIMNETLDDKTKDFKMPKNEEEVIEELVSELKVSDNYKRIEKRSKKDMLDEKDALELGINPDKYYSAKEKEDEEDEHGGSFEESSGSFGHR